MKKYVLLLWLFIGFSSVTNGQEGYIKLPLKNNTKWSFWLEEFETNCGLSSKMTTGNNLVTVQDPIPAGVTKAEQVFTFTDGVNCFTSASSQIIKNKFQTLGDWEISFLTDPSKSTIFTITKFSDELKKNEPLYADAPLIRKISVVNSNVYVKKFKTSQDYKDDDGSKGELFLKFSDGNIIEASTNKTLGEYGGTASEYDYFLLSKIYFSFNFVNGLKRIATELRLKEEKIYDTNVEKQKQIWLGKIKKCKYCNKEYKGEAFNYDKFRSKYNPCADPINIVYYDAFCSRKCALDNCKSTD
jgi:hypothetical protein